MTTNKTPRKKFTTEHFPKNYFQIHLLPGNAVSGPASGREWSTGGGDGAKGSEGGKGGP